MFKRKLIGEPITHKGHKIEARFCGPDCLCYVDDTNVGNFYLTAEAARQAGIRYIDQVEREKEKANEGQKRNKG